MSNTKRVRAVLMASAALALAGGGGAVAAEQGAGGGQGAPEAAATLEEIVVQARRVEESQQDVPVAISTVTADRLEAAAATSVSDIQRLVPALQVGQDSSGQQNFTIRGAFGGFGNDPAVINYIDEVPIESRTLVYDLYDLDSVQVLKGSQGTLFGRNSTGGAVLFFSRQPQLGDVGGYITARYGSLDERRLEGAINIPLGETVAIRASGQIQRRDGLLESVTAPGLEYGDRHNSAFRLSVLWAPSDTVRNRTQVTHYRQYEHAPAQVITQLAGPCTGPATPAPVCLYQPPFSGLLGTGNIRTFFDQEQALPDGKTVNNHPNLDLARRDSITNTLELELGSVGLRNILYYGRQDIHFTKDYDGAPVRIFDADTANDIETAYTETQLFGKLWGDRLDWRVGAVFSRDKIDYTSITAVFPLPVSTTQPRTGTADQRFDSTALFGQLSLDLSEWVSGLSATAGWRHTWDDRDMVFQVRSGQPATVCALQTFPIPASGPVPFPNTDLATCTRRLNLKFDDDNYNFTLDWKPTEQVLLYASTRRGYKAGSFNLLANEAVLTTYKPEIVNDLEAGVKADWKVGEMPMRANISAFRSRYTNIQVSTVRINPANGDINVLILNEDTATGRANRATIKGFEIEVLAAPTTWLQLSGFYSKLDSTYRDFIVPGTTQNLAGQNVAGVIPKTYGVTAQANVPLEGFASGLDVTASYYVRGAPQTNATSTTQSETSTSFDARIALRDVWGSGGDLAVFGKNLGDKVSCPINTAVTGGPTELCGVGRTYGVEFSYRFGAERR